MKQTTWRTIDDLLRCVAESTANTPDAKEGIARGDAIGTSMPQLRITYDSGCQTSKALSAVYRMLARGDEKQEAARHSDAREQENERVILICADATAAHAYPKDVCAQTITDVAFRLVVKSGIAKASMRGDRLLDENEQDVLLEDMKVTGLKPRRLKEMLKFFYRCMSDTTNETDGWMVSAEEEMVYSILIENLEARQALLPWEVSSFAYKGLTRMQRSDRTIVVVDDYGAFDAASQRLVRELGNAGFFATGSTIAARCAAIEHPCFEGFDALGSAMPTVHFDGKVSMPNKETTTFDTPRAEFEAVAESIAHSKEGSVLVATPNDTWSASIACALERHGVPYEMIERPRKVKGDPRLSDKNSALRQAALAKLSANPSDQVALRSWIGLDDWLLRSDAYAELLKQHREGGKSISEMLGQIAAGTDGDDIPPIARTKFREPLQQLRSALDAAQEGMITQPNSTEASKATPGDTEQGIADTINQANKELNSDPHPRVIIATYPLCHGIHVDHVFATGLVDGFLPHLDAVDDKHSIDHRGKALDRDHTLLRDVESCARVSVSRSLFRCDLLSNADLLDMNIERIYMHESKHFARIAPSRFVCA